MPDRLTVAEFATQVAAGNAPAGAHLVREAATGAVTAAAPEGRTIEYVFSDSSVALDGHRIMTDGWDLTSYMANPVFCLSHATDEPPIGRVVSTSIVGDQLRGVVEFADAETYPLADTIYRLAKGGFMNACSVSWDPIEWKPAAGKGRAPGSIDFLRQKMLEVSAVSVPALSTALITARAAGIDTKPLEDFARQVLTRSKNGGIPVPKTDAQPKRSLYQVSYLSDILQALASVQCGAAWEQEYEGDASEVPGQLADMCQQLGAILITMTAEETAELLESLVGVGDDTTARKAVLTVLARHLVKRGAAKAAKRAGKMVSSANADAMKGHHAAMKRSADEMSTAVDGFGEWINEVCGDGDDDGEDDGDDLADVDTENAAAAAAKRKRIADAAAARHRADA